MTPNDTALSIGDDYDYDYEEASQIFIWTELMPTLIIYSITMVLGIVGNVLIVLTTWLYKRMKSPTNLFLSSLAVTDLLLIILCIPVKIAKLFSYTWSMGVFLCKTVHYMQNFTAICSVLTLTVMSIERYYAIMYPMKAKYICTMSQTKKTIAAIWLISAILAAPILLVQILLPVGVKIQAFWCVRNLDNLLLWRIYEVYMLLVILVVPTTIMTVTYSTIALEIHRIIKMLIVIVVVFVICWAPMLIDNLLTAWSFIPYERTGEFVHYKYMGIAFHLMAYLNSCVNPIVYGFMSKHFRESFKKTLCHKKSLTRKRTLSFSLHTRTTSLRLGENRIVPVFSV
ncbi:gastrin/cholecystokinin type B receptor-like [Diaphorina citri]|uniref:Gastrin/cholecystokinin type B receptor-like n=1 Tax=Diaphorina citri TaxID=121845 RepID=A0A1S3DI66_DIACI|nr:gastrin/cholecystokinin type B receptor-like [Diaphorina citri]